MKKILLSLCFVVPVLVFAQQNVFLNISPKVGVQDVVEGNEYYNQDGVKFKLDHFDYYITNIVLVHDGGQILSLPDQVYLIEPDSHVIYLGYLDVTNIEGIKFGVGVPNKINTINGAEAVDISTQPEGSALSFQEPSMYWGWSAGYMFMIVGGLADSNNDDIADATFEIHSLGDANFQSIEMNVTPTQAYPNQIDIHLNCNLDTWIQGAPIESVGILHGSNGVNAAVLSNASQLDVFTVPETANSTPIIAEPGKVWFVNQMESVTIAWEGIVNLHQLLIFDVNGKKILEQRVEGISGDFLLEKLKAGAYKVQLINQKGQVIKNMNLVH